MKHMEVSMMDAGESLGTPKKKTSYFAKFEVKLSGFRTVSGLNSGK